MGSVFISYRREDSQAVTQQLAGALGKAMGKRNVFIDTQSILSGEVFPQRLQQALERADAFVIVIGPRWLAATDAAGQRRLDNPTDFVHYEVQFALTSGKPVIPVLLDGIQLLSALLPPDLEVLAQQPALTLAIKDGASIEAIIQRIQNTAFREELRRMPRIPYPLLFIVTILNAIIGAILLSSLTVVPAIKGLATVLQSPFYYLMTLSLVMTTGRIIQDRLWGWLVAWVLASIGSLIFLINFFLKQSGPPYSIIVIAFAGALSVSAQRLARMLAIWHNMRLLAREVRR